LREKNALQEKDFRSIPRTFGKANESKIYRIDNVPIKNNAIFYRINDDSIKTKTIFYRINDVPLKTKVIFYKTNDEFIKNDFKFLEKHHWEWKFVSARQLD
jgi:uncharacterized protein (DUF1919 family)